MTAIVERSISFAMYAHVDRAIPLCKPTVICIQETSFASVGRRYGPPLVMNHLLLQRAICLIRLGNPAFLFVAVVDEDAVS